MAWKDPRGSGSAVVAVAARTTAHRDDAKARTDDASAAARRGFPRKLLVGGGALVLVAGAVVFAVSQSGEDSDTPLAVAAAADPTSAAPSASEDPEPTPEEVLAGSVPTGKWKMVQTFKYSIQRNGQRSQSWSYDPINRTWKFPPADCTAAACTGTLRSSSGSTFEFTWDGKRLAVGERRSTERVAKAACVNTETGVEQPIALSAVRRTYHYDIPAFRGTGSRMVTDMVTRVTREWFGDCSEGPLDVVRLYERRVMTPK